jgi:hypothetical protein
VARRFVTISNGVTKMLPKLLWLTFYIFE